MNNMFQFDNGTKRCCLLENVSSWLFPIYHRKCTHFHSPIGSAHHLVGLIHFQLNLLHGSKRGNTLHKINQQCCKAGIGIGTFYLLQHIMFQSCWSFHRVRLFPYTILAQVQYRWDNSNIWYDFFPHKKIRESNVDPTTTLHPRG